VKYNKLNVKLVEEEPKYMEMAARRTEGFTKLWVLRDAAKLEPHMGLQSLVNSAYLQGVRDAYTALLHKKLVKLREES